MGQDTHTSGRRLGLQHNEVPLEFRLMAAGVKWDKVLDHVYIDTRKIAWQDVMRQSAAKRQAANTSPSGPSPALSIITPDGLPLQQLPSDKATLMLAEVNFVLYDGTTNGKIRIFSTMSMLYPRF
jgi:hypothetical protein